VIDHRHSDPGLSRDEYLRRQLTQEARCSDAPVAPSLHRFAHTVRDLADPEVMDQAWS
jgi:hypothetical protein